MTEPISGAEAFLLHQRPWRESSLLLDLFTAEHGRVALVGRGQRRRNRKGGSPGLNLFQPLLVSWRGRGELRNLTGAETTSTRWLTGRPALLGLYANELLTRVLHRDDPHPELYCAYQALLDQLAATAHVSPEHAGSAGEAALRRFEFALLDDIGYGVELRQEWATGLPIAAGQLYLFESGAGLSRLDVHTDAGQGPHDAVAEAAPAALVFAGADLLAVAAGDYSSAGARRAAKRLLRRALAPYLGPRPLESRHLFLAGRHSRSQQ